MKQRLRWLDICYIFLGSGATAAGLVIFTIPNDIAPGGLSGLATALAYLTHLPVGALTLALNIPLLLLAWRKLGLSALLKTLAATLLLSVGIDGFSLILPTYTSNILLAAVLGGVITGAGVGLLLARGISTGGTDLIALLLKGRFPNLPMGRMLMVLDAAVVLFAVIVFGDIEVALYSGVTIFIASKAIDSIQQGFDFAKVIYIITQKEAEILAVLAGEMGHGVTVLPARGGFSGENKSMLMTVARRNEVAQTLQTIKRLDPQAFTILCNATEVHGEGFKEADAF